MADMWLFALGLVVVVVLVAGIVLSVAVARAASRPRPALPLNCGDCRFMIAKAKVYKRETLEDEDGIVHYLCQQRWIEIAPYSPRCELGRSKSQVTSTPA